MISCQYELCMVNIITHSKCSSSSIHIMQHVFPLFISSSELTRSSRLLSSSSSDLTWTTATATGPGVLTSWQSRTASKSISRWTCVHCTSSHWWAPKVAMPTVWVTNSPSDTGSSTAATAATGWAGRTGRGGRWASLDTTVCHCFSFQTRIYKYISVNTLSVHLNCIRWIHQVVFKVINCLTIFISFNSSN